MEMRPAQTYRIQVTITAEDESSFTINQKVEVDYGSNASEVVAAAILKIQTKQDVLISGVDSIRSTYRGRFWPPRQWRV